MDKIGIISLCRELGCCDTCCLRYIGLKNPKFYTDVKNTLIKFQDSTANTDSVSSEDSTENSTIENQKEDDNKTNKTEQSTENGHNSNHSMNNIESENIRTEVNLNDNDKSVDTNNDSNKENVATIEVSENSNDVESPPAKRPKLSVCSSCLGVLQEDMWNETFEMVKDVVERKGYECNTFGCALSSPIAIILREKAIVLRICDKFPGFVESNVTALKEAWKWSFAAKMAASINKTLDSGAISPLLITLNYDYPDDLQELEILKTVAPKLFESRSKQRRRFTTEFTRRSVEQALENATLPSLLSAGGGLPLASAAAKCVSVVCTHNPVYLGGRYLKLSRNLPQSPWVLDGRRVLPTSVQEIIFKPLADIYKFTPEEAEQRLKFVAAGREDVDVRCLGEGRPFAIEITDPRRVLTMVELATACEEISKSGDVVVKSMVPVTRDDLTLLKEGEQTKTKTYEALCIKLGHSEFDNLPSDAPVRVTEADIKRINEFRNTPEGDAVKIKITQKTPIRVLHRRPLLTRTRGILALEAFAVPDHPRLVRVLVTTSAGTYVKEWAHGELRRSAPALSAALGPARLAALDVAAVALSWPPATQ